ncbi:MAG: ABC transporter permease [Deltaproteobacteria bacterium]|nr:ABC transporter permease [Deltaproteobacteria bacterium]
MNNQGILKISKQKTPIISLQMLVFLILILAVFALFTFLTPDFCFLKIENLNNILTDAVIPAIFAFGMGIIIAGGGIDLSLGHIASMVAIIVTYLMSRGIEFNLAILVGLVTAAGIGAVSGLLVSRLGISSLIVTLGMMFFIIGIRQIITGGQSIYINNEAFKRIAINEFGISNLVIILMIVGVLCYLIMERSIFGRKIQFVGANIKASRFMGIDVKNITMYTFILGAVLAAFGGILFAARAGAVQINSVDSKLLDALCIAVFSSVLFGRFKTIGIILVALLISMIGMGMSMMGIKTAWIDFMKGLILLFSILMAKFMNFKT